MGKGSGRTHPTYNEALGAIGRYFDQQLYRGIFVAEVDDGYIGKAHPAEEDAELHAEGFTFPLDDVSALLDYAPAAAQSLDEGPPLCPEGYGVLLSAVGHLCDHNGARCVSMRETRRAFVLGFSAPAKGGGQERRQYVLDRSAIEELLARAGV